jgi:hypothetical protein
LLRQYLRPEWRSVVILAATIGFTALIERDLLAEVLGHLRGRKRIVTVPA